MDNLPILILNAMVAPGLLCFSLLFRVVCVGYPGLDLHQRLMLSFVVYVLFFLCIERTLSVIPTCLPNFFGNQGKRPRELGARTFFRVVGSPLEGRGIGLPLNMKFIWSASRGFSLILGPRRVALWP